MMTNGLPEFNDMTDSIPSARIDAQDESYILPIREYLETHGVDVIVNRLSATLPLYHIAAGDASFVKQIFSREHKEDVKRLGIILGGGKKEERFSGKIKIVLAYPTNLNENDIFEIFEFFFTEGKNQLDLRGHHQTRTTHEHIDDERMSADHTFADRDRVSSIIAEVFPEEASSYNRIFHGKKMRRRNQGRILAKGAILCIGIIIIPILWYAISIVLAGVVIASGAQELKRGNISAVSWKMRIADYWLHQGSFVLDTVTVPFVWIGSEDNLRGQQRLVSFMNDAIQAEQGVVNITAVAGRVASGLLNQVNASSTGTTAASDITQLRISLYSLVNSLGLAQAELSMLLADRTFPFSIKPVMQKGTDAITDIAHVRESSADIDKLLSLFLALAGFREPRTYLILLQNSMELRPTGGFIGSLGLASFTDGRLTNLDVQDVYTFDGQLKGHVDPPIPVKDLLGQEHWYLRDSNWDPDFKESGSRAAWFYEKEAGTTVNGVIGISTPFITDLLSATGPIDLTDYHDRITADNFYGKSLYYTQSDFFPGSTQKKDFLGSLMNALLSGITNSDSVNTTKLFRAITTALSSHNIMIMLNDRSLQSLVERYGWAGRVPSDVGCEGTDPNSCTFSPFISVEANVGVNKVNYFITRSLDRHIDVHPDGTRTEEATIAIRNGSGSQDKNLPYHVYLRFVLPPGLSFGSTAIDGVPVPIRKIGTPAVVPYSENSTVASGLFAVGVALEVPPGIQKHVTVSYTIDKPLSFGIGGAVFDIFTQKQAGITGENVHTIITYPTNWAAGIEDQRTLPAPSDFIAKPGQLEYNTNLTRDDLTRIRFTK